MAGGPLTSSFFLLSRLLPTVTGDIYMDNYADAFFDLYVLMTTANFPDIM